MSMKNNWCHTTDDLKRIVREKFKKRKGITLDRRWMTNLIQTLINRRNVDTNLDSRFTTPKFDMYGRMIDLMKHLTVYQYMICSVSLPHETRETVMSKMFHPSLKEATMYKMFHTSLKEATLT